ncbi:AMIN domain-containing protein [Undibacterium arcticum]
MRRKFWRCACGRRTTIPASRWKNDSDLKASHFVVRDPDRLVVDIEGLELNPTLKQLVAKIQSNDPYIKQVRVGQNKPNVVRLVFDLKEAVKPQVFTLAPVGTYAHRLVLDLYPVNAPDPIAALIEKKANGRTIRSTRRRCCPNGRARSSLKACRHWRTIRRS